LLCNLHFLYLRTLLLVCHRSIDHPETPVIFAHQSKWQQNILKLYGSHMCLIDATYKTTVYDMPLFFLCVFTNVGYVNVATFLLCDECQQSIEAGLRQVAEWNAQWKPSQFITDFHEAQIAALEQVFPGKLLVISMLTVKPLLTCHIIMTTQYTDRKTASHRLSDIYLSVKVFIIETRNLQSQQP